MGALYVMRFPRLLRTCILGLAVLTTTSCEAQTTARSRIRVDQAAVPIRYSAPLPVTIAEMGLWARGGQNFPPQTQVVDTVSFGQPAMCRRLEAASRLVSESQRLAWSSRWYDLLEFQSASAEFCALARPIIQGPESTMRMAIAASYVRDCYRPEDRSSILREDTPSRAILDLFNTYKGPVSRGIEVPYDVRLERAAAEQISNGADHQARSAAFTLIEQQDPKAEAALLAIFNRLREGERKDEVAPALLRGKSPEAKRIGHEFCTRKKTDAMCSDSDPLAGFTPSEDPPRPSMASITVDMERLVAMGFPKIADLDPNSITSSAAEVLLLEAGYGYGFDVETGMFPNGHDFLLRNLAKLTGAALDTAVFEEIAPPDDDGPYELRAYLNGKRYRMAARNLGDWYDVAAVFELLDFMLADQKVPYKLVPLPTEDQTLTVIGGPRSAIDRALKANLIRRGDVGRAEQLGKGYENDVMEKLRQQ